MGVFSLKTKAATIGWGHLNGQENELRLPPQLLLVDSVLLHFPGLFIVFDQIDGAFFTFIKYPTQIFTQDTHEK
jgi:hypothetical protein